MATLWNSTPYDLYCHGRIIPAGGSTSQIGNVTLNEVTIWSEKYCHEAFANIKVDNQVTLLLRNKPVPVPLGKHNKIPLPLPPGSEKKLQNVVVFKNLSPSLITAGKFLILPDTECLLSIFKVPGIDTPQPFTLFTNIAGNVIQAE